MAAQQRWFAEQAILPSGLAHDVRFDVVDGSFAAVTPDAQPDGARRFPGIALPGFANTHSHAFHRALRGRTHNRPGGGTAGDFWTWRDRMYRIAERLDPDTYLALARATYAEMARAGVTAVGEFHYLHHAPGGARYTDPNAMGHALIRAAGDAGLRLTLLDTCYLAGGLDAEGHTPLNAVQMRFSDGDAAAWQDRVGDLNPTPKVRIGAAVHSVRAVPAGQLPTVVGAAAGWPLHFHLSEQPAENEAALRHYGRTPAALLEQAGALGPLSTAVHATHLTATDVARIGGSGTTVCFCPTTERDLADGIGPAHELALAGSRLSLGSDQHAVIDPFEEARGLEMHERLSTGERGRFTGPQLLAALTDHASLGWDDAGELAVGRRADLVHVDLDSARTAGIDPAQVLFAATAADVRDVFVDGRAVVTDGQHILGDVGRLLTDAIRPLWSD